MYSLKIILLENCFYSNEVKKILSKNPFNKIPIEYITIKENDKNKYKTDEITTFPQVYIVKKQSNSMKLIGGCDSVKKIIDIINIKNIKNINNINNIKKLISKLYPLWSEKDKLRLIELFIN